MPDFSFREIIREHEFEDQLNRLIPNSEEADDYIVGAEFTLAVYPQSGMPAAEDRSIWYLPMCPVRGKRVSLFYDFDEQFVNFLAILPYDD
jgi:hypothetical protein